MTNLLYILMTKLHTHDLPNVHTCDKTTYTCQTYCTSFTKLYTHATPTVHPLQNYIHMINLIYILVTQQHTHDKPILHTHDKTTYTC